MRYAVFCLLLISLPFAAGCGGGGGGDDAGPVTLPGVLTALALQGDATPIGAASAGTFAPFIVGAPVMDCAEGGWSAFVATVNLTLGGQRDVLYVAEPNGTLHEIYAVGDADPGMSGGTITGFSCVWMCDDGTVYASVTMTGPPFALLTARVTGGLAQAHAQALVAGQLMPNGGAFTLAGVDFPAAILDDTCTFWFLGTLSNAVVSLYSVEPDGSGGLRHVSTNENVPPGDQVQAFDTFGVAEDGTWFAFVATRLNTGTQGVYLTQLGSAVHRAIGLFGDPAPDGNGTIADAWKDGNPLLVFSTGQVLWIASGSLSANDDIMLFNSTILVEPPSQFARVGDFAPGTTTGTLSGLTMLNQRVNTVSTFPQFFATISGGNGIVASIYAIGNGQLNRFIYNGRPFSGGGLFTGTFPGLITPKFRDGSRDTALVFRDLLDTGTNGMFWVFADRGPFAVALQGDPALGGTDTWGSFANTAHTCEQNVLLFTALLTGAGSGIFRQG